MSLSRQERGQQKFPLEADHEYPPRRAPELQQEAGVRISDRGSGSCVVPAADVVERVSVHAKAERRQ
jgi:hypothetical protein